MARVTVEDCLQNVDNRFQLVLVAAKRARQLTMGKEPMVDWENDKATVVALREISEGLVDRTILDKEPEPEKKEETLEDLLAAAEESSTLAPVSAGENEALSVTSTETTTLETTVTEALTSETMTSTDTAVAETAGLSATEQFTTDQPAAEQPEQDDTAPEQESDSTPNI